jgi:hypothetical protein
MFPALPASLLLLVIAIGLAAVALSSVHQADAIAWGAVALAVYCVALLLAASALADYNGLGLSAWRIGPWSLVWGALAFGLATLTWLGPQTGPPAEILPVSILRALWLIAVAMTMLTAGYCGGPFRLAGRPATRAAYAMTRRFTDQIRSPAVPWWLFGVGLVAQAASAALTGRFGYVGDVASSVTSASGFGQYLGILGECVPLAVAAATIRALETRRPQARLTAAILFAAACAAGAIAGGKQSFVVAILAVVVPRAATRRRLPAGWLTAALLFFLLLIIPFNVAYRASARGAVTLSTGQAVATAPAILWQTTVSDVSLSGITQSAILLAERLQSIDSPAIIMQRTPAQIPYRNTTELAEDPAVDIVPRILWPAKPILAVGYQVSQEYFELPPSLLTSSAVTPEGDLYRHGGWVPLVAGMFLLGSGLRVLDDAMDLRASVHGSFLIILLFPGIVQAETDWGTLLSGFPGMVLLWYGVTACAFARRPMSAPAA